LGATLPPAPGGVDDRAGPGGKKHGAPGVFFFGMGALAKTHRARAQPVPRVGGTTSRPIRKHGRAIKRRMARDNFCFSPGWVRSFGAGNFSPGQPQTATEAPQTKRFPWKLGNLAQPRRGLGGGGGFGGLPFSGPKLRGGGPGTGRFSAAGGGPSGYRAGRYTGGGDKLGEQKLKNQRGTKEAPRERWARGGMGSDTKKIPERA